MQMRSLVCGCISEWFESGLRVTLHVKKTNVWWRNSYGGITGEGINFFPIRFMLPQRKKIPPPQLSSTCGDATINRLLPLGIFASYKLIFVHFIFVLFCWFFFFYRNKAAEYRMPQHQSSAAGPGSEEELQHIFSLCPLFGTVEKDRKSNVKSTLWFILFCC